MVSKNDPSIGVDTAFQGVLEFGTEENVIAQNQGHRIIANEIFAQNEGLRQSIRRGLNTIFKSATQVRAIAQ